MWTFFARRVKANPSYYGAKSRSDSDVEDFLLSVATDSLIKLKDQGCVITNGDEIEDEVQATTLGLTGSSFYLKHSTPKQMQFGLREAARLIIEEMKRSDDVTIYDNEVSLQPYSPTDRIEELSVSWLLYSLSFSHEFDELPVRHNEEVLNEQLSEYLIWGADTAAVQSTESNYIYRSPDVFLDPHTKCFLLIQVCDMIILSSYVI
jgi:replicative superfamily II helicase